MAVLSSTLLKNQWYAVEFVHLVGVKPHRVPIMGQDFVRYQTSR